MPRDEFTVATKDTLAKLVALKCSNPSCRVATSGPHSEAQRFVNVGVASHLTATAPGGPRYDASLAAEVRGSIENAIWLCQTCAKLIDSDTERFSDQILRSWKIAAEVEALQALNGDPQSEFFPQPTSAKHTPIPKIAGLTYDEARIKLVDAGWQPMLNHWSYGGEPHLQYGNGLHFWEKGYHEIINASGTGLAHCAFEFQDVYGNRLVIATAGEVIDDLSTTAYVWSWYFADRDDT